MKEKGKWISYSPTEGKQSTFAKFFVQNGKRKWKTARLQMGRHGAEDPNMHNQIII